MDIELLPKDAPKPLLQFHHQDNGPMFLGKIIKIKEEMAFIKVHL